MLASLKGDPLVSSPLSTDGIEISEWRFGSVQLSCLDFAGQEIYYDNHTLFLSPKAIHVIVFNMTESVQQSLRYWLKTLASIAPKAPIILVGTRIDHKDSIAFPSELAKDLANELGVKSVVGTFEVSCTKGTNIDRLRKSLLRISTQLTQQHPKVPLSFIRLREIMITNRKLYFPPVLPFYDFIETCERCKIIEKWKALDFLQQEGIVLSLSAKEEDTTTTTDVTCDLSLHSSTSSIENDETQQQQQQNTQSSSTTPKNHLRKSSLKLSTDSFFFQQNPENHQNDLKLSLSSNEIPLNNEKKQQLDSNENTQIEENQNITNLDEMATNQLDSLKKNKYRYQNSIILDPSWLSEVSSSLYSFSHSFGKDGFLSPSQLSQIWISKKYGEEIHSLLTNLLENFDIILKLNDEEILFPSFLPNNPPSTILTLWNKIYSNSNYLKRRFQLPFIPNGVFIRCLVKLIQLGGEYSIWRSGIYWKSSPIFCYSGVLLIVFNSSSSSIDIFLEILENSYSIGGILFIISQIIESSICSLFSENIYTIQVLLSG